MAAKSDFAQKLLLDLRLRKERMGASQSSSRSNSTPRDAYRDPGNMHRGSRQSKSLNSISGSKSTNQLLISSRETSQQIVSYNSRQHHRSESTGDLSMAFTFKNVGKLMNMDFKSSSSTNTMIDFLNRIGGRSLDAGNARNGTITSLVKQRPANGGVVSPAPALTTIQIKEISKGVQNLYEIIRSSSNGANVDRYSMEVGKELLKGAKGLEESLRMLVNLQEASELMVNPQRKSRITLLEVDDDNGEDERSKATDRNQVALPRFSFDKPSKKLNLPVTDGSVKFSSHRRLATVDDESIQSVSSAKTTSNRSEKGRISNVIAKLMGLEEIPVKVDDSSTNSVNKAQRVVKDAVIPMKMELDYKRDEVKKADDLNKNTLKKASRSVKDVVDSVSDRKPQQSHNTKVNGELSMKQSNKNKRSDRVSEKLEKQSNGESKEKVHSKRRSPEVAVNLQVEKKKTVRKETSNEIKLVPRNNQIQEPERRTQRSKQDSQQIKQGKNTSSIPKESKSQPLEEIQKVKDSTPKVEKQETTEQKMAPVTRKKVDLVAVGRIESPRAKDEVLRKRNRTINSLSTPSKHKLLILKETKRKEVQICSEPEEIKTKGSDSISNANVTESTARSYDIVPKCEKETKCDPQKTSEIAAVGKNTRIKGNSNLSENKPKKTFHSSETETKSHPQITLDIATAGKNIAITGNTNLSTGENTTIKGNNTNIFENTSKKAFQSSENEMKSDPQVTLDIVVAGKTTRITDDSMFSENKPKKTFHSSVQIVLTEQEKQLKEILIKDQLFLSTAEALFKLNIPVGFLHVDDHNHRGHDTKLKLDCGYEILKRKARSQELSVHPYVKPSIADMSIRFLDELVKQLHKDLEGLRVYGRDSSNLYDEADYLHHMLEKDIHNKNPDINSFWDFGWHITTFTFVEKDEFVNDVEQDMLRILVDEIVDDLLSM